MSLQKLEIEQEGVGKLELQEKIPKAYEKYVLPGTIGFSLEGDGLHALFQVWIGKGFRVWYSRYWTTKRVVLKGRGGFEILELRMSWKNQFKSSWEKIAQPQVPELHYQLGFVPHTITRGEFEANKEYQTFDLHCDTDFLEEIGIDYKLLRQFVAVVMKGQPAELYPAPRKCPGEMIHAAHRILRNGYSLAGKMRLLENNVGNILLAVLEDADPEGVILPELSASQYDSIHYARELIEQHFPVYLGNRALAQKVGMSLTYFIMGFKRVFGETPLVWYNLMRLERSKELLMRGYTVRAVAMELEYENDTSFGRAFKKKFGIPPKAFQLRCRT